MNQKKKKKKSFQVNNETIMKIYFQCKYIQELYVANKSLYLKVTMAMSRS